MLGALSVSLIICTVHGGLLRTLEAHFVVDGRSPHSTCTAGALGRCTASVIATNTRISALCPTFPHFLPKWHDFLGHRRGVYLHLPAQDPSTYIFASVRFHRHQGRLPIINNFSLAVSCLCVPDSPRFSAKPETLGKSWSLLWVLGLSFSFSFSLLNLSRISRVKPGPY